MTKLRNIDNFDDRREIVIQLGHMSKSQRIEFLNWAIDLAPINLGAPKGTPKPLRVTSEGTNPFPWGSAEQAYFDLMTAFHQHAVPVDIVLAELEKRAALKKLVLQ